MDDIVHPSYFYKIAKNLKKYIKKIGKKLKKSGRHVVAKGENTKWRI